MNKDKLLIVGAFPSKDKQIYGGILKSCRIILDSPLAENFHLITIDSSQLSNPAPNMLIRSFFAFKRIILLVYKLIFASPKVALIFTSDGFSAIEKGIMCLICSFFGCKSMIFPRAGNLIIQTKKSKLMMLLVRFLYRKASIFLCQGDNWKNFAIEHIGFENKNVKIINNWTATKEHINLGIKRNYNKNEEIKKLLFVGWLEEFKGVFELLESSKELIEEGYQFHLSFAGDGNGMLKAKQYIENNNLSDFVDLYGWVDDSRLLGLLEQNDIFILPSWAEGLPNAMIEAMSSGLSVIVSKVGAIPNFINNNENGLLVDSKDKPSLKKAIKNLLDDSKLQKKLALNGHEFAKRKFSSQIGIQRLLEVIEEIIDKK